MKKGLLDSLDSAYRFGEIGTGNAALNPLYGMLFNTTNRQMKLPVLGETTTGMQLPLDQIPSMTGQFSNAAVEMAFYEQQLMEHSGLSLPLDYYKHHTHTLALDALYMLKSSACVVERKDGKHSLRTSSLDVVKSFPRDMIENYSVKRHDAYLAVDARPDVERGVLRTLELRGTNTHRLRIYCVETQLKGCTIVPHIIAVVHMRKLLRILGGNVVTLRYKQENGNIMTLTASLRMDFLQKHCGKNAKNIISHCRNACNEMELTLPVIPEGAETARIFTLNILGICSVCKAVDSGVAAQGKARISR